MNVWRPQQNIQFKALGLVWRDACLLASEIYQDDGSVKGVRPLGGRLEFGETWHDALLREFEEELQVRVEVVGKPLFLENIYSHQGMVGHEIVVLSDVLFPDTAYHQQDVIEYLDDNGERCRARWFNPENLDCGGLELYPHGLKRALAERRRNF
ncbi:NUDIX hydrolase [Hyphobacterium sp.]|uniref:NUDIX hydrolase n=1 Tax=Hyphobacterium sp. TaxID=2004662 RepID=UPI003BA939C8